MLDDAMERDKISVSLDVDEDNNIVLAMEDSSVSDMGVAVVMSLKECSDIIGIMTECCAQAEANILRANKVKFN